MSVATTRAFAGAANGYTYLRHMDRAGWAWEWLRRNTVYQGMKTGSVVQPVSEYGSIIRSDEAAERRAAKWGLCFRRRS